MGAADTTITDVRLLGARDANYDVSLAQGTIRAIEPAGSARTGGDVVAGRGRTLMPGVIDTHVHQRPSRRGTLPGCEEPSKSAPSVTARSGERGRSGRSSAGEGVSAVQYNRRPLRF